MEPDISFPSETGKLIPLPRRGRKHHWETKGLIPDDGFREFKSTVSTSYDKTNLNNFYKLNDCRSIIKTNGERLVYPECN